MIWIFGNGMLGKEIYKYLYGEEYVNLYSRRDVDISDYNQLEYFVSNKLPVEDKPNIIINCAAMTDVDGCEVDQKKCIYDNFIGATNLAMISNHLNATYVHVSTDFVFDGEKGEPYYEMETPNPISLYGKVKWIAEEVIQKHCKDYLIVRTSTVFSKDKGFVRSVLNKIEDGQDCMSMYPFVRNPTPVVLLAYNICNQVQMGVRGIIHIVGNERITMDNFARMVVDKYKQEVGETDLIIRTSEMYPLTDKAKRPVDSSLVVSEYVNQFRILEDYISDILFQIKVDKFKD